MQTFCRVMFDYEDVKCKIYQDGERLERVKNYRNLENIFFEEEGIDAGIYDC